MIFSPKGNSARMTYTTGNVPQNIALPAMNAENPAIRIYFNRQPTSGVAYFLLGDATAVVTPETGMPFDATTPLVVPVTNGETHISLAASGGGPVNANVTSGGIVV